MEKNKSLVAFFFVAIVFLVLFFYNAPSDEDLKELAILEKSPDNCLKIKNREIKNSCITTVAVETKDIELCSLTENAQYEPSKGWGLPPDDEKGVCQYNVVKKYNTMEYCQSIKNSEAKDRCIGIISIENLSPDTCHLIETIAEKDYCFYNIAVKNNNRSLCELVNDIPARDSCLKNEN